MLCTLCRFRSSFWRSGVKQVMVSIDRHRFDRDQQVQTRSSSRTFKGGGTLHSSFLNNGRILRVDWVQYQPLVDNELHGDVMDSYVMPPKPPHQKHLAKSTPPTSPPKKHWSDPPNLGDAGRRSDRNDPFFVAVLLRAPCCMCSLLFVLFAVCALVAVLLLFLCLVHGYFQRLSWNFRYSEKTFGIPPFPHRSPAYLSLRRPQLFWKILKKKTRGESGLTNTLCGFMEDNAAFRRRMRWEQESQTDQHFQKSFDSVVRGECR